MTASFVIIHRINMTLNKFITWTIPLHIPKDFDMVWPGGCYINSPAMENIEVFSTKFFLNVVVNGQTTKAFKFNVYYPQRYLPLLCYILITCLWLLVSMYADDKNDYRCTSQKLEEVNLAVHLTSDLSYMDQWRRVWLIKFNTTKISNVSPPCTSWPLPHEDRWIFSQEGSLSWSSIGTKALHRYQVQLIFPIYCESIWKNCWFIVPLQIFTYLPAY